MKRLNRVKRIAFVVILGLSFALHAQREKGKRYDRNEFTPDQQAVLKTKKMALQLDLSEDQQDKLMEINKSWAERRNKEREEFKAKYKEDERPDSDARFEHMLKRLDHQMAYQKQVQKILDKDQYTAWKEQQEKRIQGHACRKGRSSNRNGEKRES